MESVLLFPSSSLSSALLLLLFSSSSPSSWGSSCSWRLGRGEVELTLVLLTELLLRTLFSRAESLLPCPVCIAKRLSARARPGIDLDLQHNSVQYGLGFLIASSTWPCPRKPCLDVWLAT